MRNKALSLAITLTLLLTLSGAAMAQDKEQKRTLVINGRTGEATVFQINGQIYVALGILAQIGNGSLGFQGDRIVFTLPAGAASAAATVPAISQPAAPGLSRNFMRAGIEEMAVIREWRSTLAYAIKNGYPVVGNWVANNRDQAAESLRLASVAASTDFDRQALQLLTNEFNNVKRWSNGLLNASENLDMAQYSMSPTALDNDPQFQKILGCAHFMASMLTSGQFQDDGSCD